jgi:hypothetical protein
MGANFLTMYGATPNTNPNKQYGYPASIRKGGAFFHKSNSPGQALDAKLVKRGEACNHGVLWLVSWGDSSIYAAASSAGIKKIGSVDSEMMAILSFLYQSNCTIVMGE